MSTPATRGTTRSSNVLSGERDREKREAEKKKTTAVRSSERTSN